MEAGGGGGGGGGGVGGGRGGVGGRGGSKALFKTRTQPRRVGKNRTA